MSSPVCGKELVPERTVEPGVFEEMDSSFELSDSDLFALSVRFQFPKFSKGFIAADFDAFIQEHIGIPNVVSIGRLNFPNEWQMQLANKDVREKIIRIGRTKINNRTCWIAPLSQSEVRGYVHWIPSAVRNSYIVETLMPFGEVVFIENQKQSKWKTIDSDSRYFALNLKPGQVVDDIPHFVKICDSTGLITIKGRNPCCFHCREIGHRKSECKTFREKLSDYNSRKPNAGKKRTKPRGRRHRPEQVTTIPVAEEKPLGAKPKTPINQTAVKSKKKKNSANKMEQKTKIEEEINETEGRNDANSNNKSEGTVNVETTLKMAINSNVSEEYATSLTQTLDLGKVMDVLPSDGHIKRRLVLFQEFANILSDEGSLIQNKLNNFCQKWFSDGLETTDVPVTSAISPLDTADVQNENSACASEGKKKKKKKKKKNKAQQ